MEQFNKSTVKLGVLLMSPGDPKQEDITPPSKMVAIWEKDFLNYQRQLDQMDCQCPSSIMVAMCQHQCGKDKGMLSTGIGW